MVLDEPTNDLDLETLDLLQELLADYKGTVILASHDRDFLDRVVTSVIAAEGDGKWVEYAGGYSDMLAQRGGDLPQSTAKAPRPKQTKPETPKSRPKSSTAKLTFKDKHALETLPGEIAKLEAQIAELQSILADPDLFSKDADTFQKAAEELQNAEAAIADAEERWLELEMKREDLESG